MANRFILTNTTAAQLRLEYDADSYADFTVDSAGGLLITAVGGTRLGTVQTSSPSAAVHNHDPSDARVLRVVPTASIDWTGISGGTNLREIKLGNYSSSFTITVKHESASSSVGNKISTPNGSDYVIANRESVELWYDATSSLWRF